MCCTCKYTSSYKKGFTRHILIFTNIERNSMKITWEHAEIDSVQAGQKSLIPSSKWVAAIYLPSGESCPWSLVRSSRQVLHSVGPQTPVGEYQPTPWRWLGASWWSSLGFSWPQLPGETPNLELLVCQKPASACVGRPKTSNYFVYSQVGQPWILVTEIKNIPSIFQWQFWGRRSSGPASDSSNRSCKGWSRSPHELCPSFALHSWQSHCQILDISTISLSDFFLVWLSPTIYVAL